MEGATAVDGQLVAAERASVVGTSARAAAAAAQCAVERAGRERPWFYSPGGAGAGRLRGRDGSAQGASRRQSAQRPVDRLIWQVSFQRHSLDELAHTLVRVADEGHLPELRSVVIAYEPVTQSVRRCHRAALIGQTFICNCRLIRESAQETIAIGSQCSAAGSDELTQWRDGAFALVGLVDITGKAAWLVAVGDRRPELLRVCSAGMCPARSTLVSFAKGLPTGPLPLLEDTLPIVDIPARQFVPKSEVARVMVCIAGWSVGMLSIPLTV